MKYFVYFGDSDIAGIVDCPKNDVDSIIVEAVELGIAYVVSEENMMDEFRLSEHYNDPDWDVIQFANYNDYAYYEQLRGYVDLSEFTWAPMPPNTKTGAFDVSEEPGRNKYGRVSG